MFKNWVLRNDGDPISVYADPKRLTLYDEDGVCKGKLQSGSDVRLYYPKPLSRFFDVSLEARGIITVSLRHAPKTAGHSAVLLHDKDSDDWHTLRIKSTRTSGIVYTLDGKEVKPKSYVFKGNADKYFNIWIRNKAPFEIRNLQGFR